MRVFCCSRSWTSRGKRLLVAQDHGSLVKEPGSFESSSAASEAHLTNACLMSPSLPTVASSQQLLRVHGVNTGFQLHDAESLPATKGNDEVLIQVLAVGLNPIDWKGLKFGWGLPSLPCVLGRDLIGVVVQVPYHGTKSSQHSSDLKVGAIVGAISTDYRDYRKAAFQQYAVASTYNIYRIPASFEGSQQHLAGIGVAFVTAALTLGVSFGTKLFQPSLPDRPLDILHLVRQTSQHHLPADVYDECFSVNESERLERDECLLIWGAGTTVGLFLAQLAKMIGVKVICVADATKSGRQLVEIGVDLLVHRHDTTEAARIVRSITQDRGLYYVADVVGAESAGLVQSLLKVDTSRKSHIASIVGSPKEKFDHVKNHKVPVKLFHEVPRLGAALMQLLEDLLSCGMLTLPDVHISNDKGLASVPSALETLREGTFPGQRIVVPI